MTTSAAARFDDRELPGFCGVASRDELTRVGVGADSVAAQAAARRWQTFGQAVLLHNAEPTFEQRCAVARINCGPRALLTSFSAAYEWGLRGWERPEIHVLAPAGTRRPADRAVDATVHRLVLHRTGDWPAVDLASARRLHRLAPALLVAAGGFTSARSACGLVAAAVQQRLLGTADLRRAVAAAPRIRHRHALLLAIADIEQGAEALSEIDFARVCRRAGLPQPARQTVRSEPSGRRRYLDVEWRLPDGRARAVEVDGALHTRAQTWVADQLRQNEVVIGGTPVLRFPSVVIRADDALVVDQLSRFLRPHR